MKTRRASIALERRTGGRQGTAGELSSGRIPDLLLCTLRQVWKIPPRVSATQ